MRLLVHNATDTTFHDILVTAIGGWHPRSRLPIPIHVLPPGDCFARASRAKEEGKKDYAWSIETVKDGAVLSPVMYCGDHAVTEIAFTDAAGGRWHWTPGDGLRVVAERS